MVGLLVVVLLDGFWFVLWVWVFSCLVVGLWLGGFCLFVAGSCLFVDECITRVGFVWLCVCCCVLDVCYL